MTGSTGRSCPGVLCPGAGLEEESCEHVNMGDEQDENWKDEGEYQEKIVVYPCHFYKIRKTEVWPVDGQVSCDERRHPNNQNGVKDA